MFTLLFTGIEVIDGPHIGNNEGNGTVRYSFQHDRSDPKVYVTGMQLYESSRSVVSGNVT